MPTQTISRCGGGPAVGYPGTVLTVAAADTLRGYWRLGETSSPFLDSSGWSGGPSPMTLHVGAHALLLHQTGALPPGEDDGSITSVNAVSGNDYLDAATAMLVGVASGFTIAAWVKPTLSASTWRGGIFGNQGVIAGSPSHEEGWDLEGQWTGAGINARLVRVKNNVAVAASAAISFGSWVFVVGTYDGTNIRLYLNGALAATTADARAMISDVTGAPTINRITFTAGGGEGDFYGGIDEVAFWGTVLTAGQVSTLYVSGL